MRETELLSHQRAFIEEITRQNPDWVKERRLEFLNNEIERLKKDEAEWNKIKKEAPLGLVWRENIHEISRLLNRYTAEVEAYTNPKYNPDEITQAMIENAREYPIDRIIKVNERGFAICPFHNDKNPSAYCRNNYLYCFSCGEHADTIKLAMKLWNTNFPLTIKKLQ
jgi:hypothetical protein